MRTGGPPVWDPQDGFLIISNGTKLVETFTDDLHADDSDLRVRRQR